MSDQLKAIQRKVGVKDDGVYGSATENAIAVALDCVLSATTDLTTRTVEFTAFQEGFIAEAYKDSVGVWTAFLGVTNASGHEVYPRYKDNPQPLETGLEVSVWLMREKYLPPVLKAFEGYALQEHELAAALSFHWNTGAILTTSWVTLVKQGEVAQARTFLETHYTNGGTLSSRREMEANLFFDADWPEDMRVPVYQVSKPSYSPARGTAKKTDMSADITKALAA